MPPKKSATRKTASRPRDATPEILGFTPSKTATRFLQERPAIPVKQSFAYGAPGKVTVPRRLAPANRKADVVGAIEQIIEEGIEQESLEELPEDPPEDEPKTKKGVPNHPTTPRSETSSEPPSPPLSETPSEPPSEPPSVPPSEPTSPPSGTFGVEGTIAGNADLTQRRPRPTSSIRCRNAFTHKLSVIWRYCWPRLRDLGLLCCWIFAIMFLIFVAYRSIDWAAAKIRSAYSVNTRHDTYSVQGDTRAWSSSQYDSLRDLMTHEYSSLKGRMVTQYDDLKDRMASVEHDLSTLHSRSIAHIKVNFFALGTGVLVDPYLTSPTKQLNDGGRRFWLLGWLLGMPPILPRAPTAAFTAWDDIGDCWCAPEAGGRSQLTVLLPKRIVPTELVVEHIPMEATLDPGATPKDIELWIQIPDAQVREHVANAAFTYLSRNGDEDENPNNAHAFFTQKALDKTWVRVGRWQYNVYTSRNVQTFRVPVPLEHYGAGVKKVSVRTLSSWGDSEYVCLYRLRLHGLLSNTSSMYSTVST